MSSVFRFILLSFIFSFGEFANPQIDTILPSTSDRILSISWSPNGHFLAVGGGNPAPILEIWDTETNQLLQTLVGHDGVISSLDWSPDGSSLVSASYDGIIKIWDTETWELKLTISVEPLNDDMLRPVLAIAWSPDGQYIASAHILGTIYIWDAISGEQIHRLNHYNTREVSSVAWSPDGMLLASGSADGAIKIWNTISWKSDQLLQTDDLVSALAWVSTEIVVNGNRDGSLQIWNISSDQPLFTSSPTRKDIIGIIWDIDNSRIIAMSEDGILTIWDESGELLNSFSVDKRIIALAYNPHTEILVYSSMPLSNEPSSAADDTSLATLTIEDRVSFVILGE